MLISGVYLSRLLYPEGNFEWHGAPFSHDCLVLHPHVIAILRRCYPALPIGRKAPSVARPTQCYRCDVQRLVLKVWLTDCSCRPTVPETCENKRRPCRKDEKCENKATGPVCLPGKSPAPSNIMGSVAI